MTAIEKAADLLETACKEMKIDPYSQRGRDHLIAGSRGILQGTTAMLVSFDESQVRRLCRDCKKVLDYLAISEVIETMEDLVQFVKDLSPCLSKVCHDVDVRRKDLLNPYQRDNLSGHLEQVKTLAPILICSMKIFIQILSQEGKGTDEAIENRNYLAKRMTDEVTFHGKRNKSREFNFVNFIFFSPKVGEIQRILEDTSKEDPGGMKMNGSSSSGSGISGLNLNDMTFHEILKRVSSSLNSQKKDHTLNQKAIQHIVELGFKIVDGFEGATKAEIHELCNELDRVNRTSGYNLNVGGK